MPTIAQGALQPDPRSHGCRWQHGSKPMVRNSSAEAGSTNALGRLTLASVQMQTLAQWAMERDLGSHGCREHLFMPMVTHSSAEAGSTKAMGTTVFTNLSAEAGSGNALGTSVCPYHTPCWEERAQLPKVCRKTNSGNWILFFWGVFCVVLCVVLCVVYR